MAQTFQRLGCEVSILDMGQHILMREDSDAAEMARRHNDANVLCVAGDLTGEVLLRKIVEVWLGTQFNGGRHERRVRKITAIEDGKDPKDVKNHQ